MRKSILIRKDLRLGLLHKVFFMRAIYAAILFLIIFSSCSKDYGTTTVSGKVVDATTGEPVPFANVILGDRASESFTSGYVPRETFKADENGSFSFSFEAKRKAAYGLNASKEHYFSAADEPYLKNGAKNEDIEIKITPGGWIRFHLKDEAPLGDVSRFTIHPFVSPSSVEIDWPPLDTTFTVYTSGNKEALYPYWLIVNYKEERATVNIKTKALDTTDVYIKY